MRAPSRAATGALVLDLVRTHGTVSRVELADRSGLTAATITHVVRDLLAEGLLREVGRLTGGVGSPRRLLELDAGAGYAVGVQLDRSASSVVVTDFAGRRVASTGVRGAGRGRPEETLPVLARHIDLLLEGAGIARGRVLGVGLVTHGPQDRERGTVLTGQPTPEWRGFPLTSTLSGLLDLPVLLENDATAAAVGEQWVGALDVDTFGVLYMATGIGGGVVAGAEVYRGGTGNPVEVGHIPVDPGGPACACGNRGCVEALAGPGAVVAAATREPGLAARLRLDGRPDARLADFQRVARAAVAGDPVPLALVEASARRLGTAAVTLMNLFDLDTVVLAGPAFGVAGALYVDRAQEVVDAGALARLLRPVRVRLSRDVGVSAAVGGALVVLRSALGRPAPAAPAELTSA
ncbi:ROK family transcriptional regulator [Cellulomonas endometrii]|uniref:ROK family transcriptional regulator n=1 Tax=Cellulomonas endometrii TaxID=3036301 RepID=UPI0024ACE472|nr:ROK family transcriptional regulator [Cellulomonas endometrii]